MRRFLTFLALIIVTHDVHSQVVSHSLIELQRNYEPLFGNTSAIMRMDFVQTYTLGKTDTTYTLTVSVNEKTVEVQNVSLGTAFFSSTYSRGSGFGLGADYNVEKKEGVEVLNYDEFIAIYDCSATVYTYITTLEIKKNVPFNTVASCQSEELIIGVEFVPKREYEVSPSYKFYFQIGEATFSLKKNEFEELAKTLRKIKDLWNQKLTIRS